MSTSKLSISSHWESVVRGLNDQDAAVLHREWRVVVDALCGVVQDNKERKTCIALFGFTNF